MTEKSGKLPSIHQITSGMAGWLTFEQMRKGVDNLREAELKKPVEIIAAARGFEVKGEFPLPRYPGQQGDSSRLDFLLVHRSDRRVIALELKFKGAGRMAGSISHDAGRMHSLSIEQISQQIEDRQGRPQVKRRVDGYSLYKAVIIVWRRSLIMEQMQRECDVIQSQFDRLIEAALPEGVLNTSNNCRKMLQGEMPFTSVGRSFGSLRAGSTISEDRFWVASFINESSWADIRT